ncbi:cyclic nucleotide-binding domain protein (macronuclear) [Tetrahymena thermophila SB210]|uniref:Cyclic nucleotide-binding domain protein n=1 Tax=Tetrahymena thermophila (strain SB210) TaxID=312017 RepID=Q22HI8_TETTS|nr:cyclic nucleotide-binding domain protein [Tetrahymena thermophila SB210]EAR84713.2 cyclic nucleotide-binding domain protein [Tetrahymena thermophila SB210]|eukprot:XP_001032376.2 cyclic nucleotide-binding domain protein [Tetrahymena thermophila SB210]
MSRLNAFFQLVDDPQTPPWKKQAHSQIKELSKHSKKQTELDAQEKKRLNLIQQKFAGFLQFDYVKETNQDKDGDSSYQSSEDYPDDDEYNAFQMQDEENTQFNKIGIDSIMKALSKKKKSAFEVKLLSHALMHNPFFKKMRKQITETLYEELFKEIYLESYNSLDTVFEFGDTGDKFYIILQGEVYILSPTQLGIALQQIEKQKEEQAIDKLKQESTLQSQKMSANFNQSQMPNDKINELQRNSSRHKMSYSKNIATGEDDQTPNSFSSQSPVQQIKRQQESLRKQAINRNHNQQKLNDSFSSFISSEQTPLNQESENYSKFLEKDQQLDQDGASERVRSRNSSFSSSKSQSIRPKQLSLNERQKEEKKCVIEQKIYQKYPNFYIVKKLQTGDNFGEIALRMDKERTATIVCKSNCKFAVISKKGFQRILGDFFRLQLEEKEQFLQNIELFKGYNFAFLANILMNIKKKIYNFDDIIYEEGQDSNKKLYFIKSGEVELSKRVVIPDDPADTPQSKQFKKNDRVVIAQKQSKEWFGEVEIMQNMKRFTRARCVSAKLEVFYITALKFFANINIEQMITDMKKSSQMIDEWRQKHYEQMVSRIYNSKRDPLRKTFSNMQVAHDLINQKFKQEFMKVKPQQIILSKPEETSLAAKIVYFNSVKSYVNKISDVIGTISKQKYQSIIEQKKDASQKENDLNKRKEQALQLRSLSLPRNSQILNTSQNSIQSHARNLSQSSQHQNTPCKLPLILSAEQFDEISAKKSISTAKNSTNTNLASKSVIINAEHEKLPQLNQHQINKFQTEKSQNFQTEISQTTDRERKVQSSFSTPMNKKIKLNLNKKILSHLCSQNELEDSSARNNLSQNFPLTTPHTSCTLNYIQHPSKPLISDRLNTDNEILENLYQEIVGNKQKQSKLIFNKEMNQKMVEEGMRKKNLQLHQSKQHGCDFTNLQSSMASLVGIPNESLGQDQLKKLKLYRKLKLDNILDYKYQNKLKIELAQKQLQKEAYQNQIQINKTKDGIESIQNNLKFTKNQTSLIPKTFSSKIIQSKQKFPNAFSQISLKLPLPQTNQLVNKSLNHHDIFNKNTIKKKQFE